MNQGPESEGAGRAFGFVALVLAANFATSSLGKPITGEGGKFAISNILPVLFIGTAGWAWLMSSARLPKPAAVAFIGFNASVLCSFAIYLLRYQWMPNWVVLAFQDVELVFSALLWWYGLNRTREFRNAALAGLLLLLPVCFLLGLQDLRSGSTYSPFGMDDKSHAAVLLASASFILLRFYPRLLWVFPALALYGMSFLTSSRLPALFAPAILLALLTRRGHGFVIGSALLGCAVAVAVVYGDLLTQLFVVFERLSSVNAVVGSESTSAHVLLIQTAWQLKFTDFWSFVFGIGPSNFSKALLSFPVPLAELSAVDPTLLDTAQQGAAPVHSLVMAMILDYHIVVGIAFLGTVLFAAGWLARRSRWIDLLFLAGALAASSFYSLHNKAYFFLVSTSIALLIIGQERERSRARACSLAGPVTAPVAAAPRH